jgi:hypothetical protein
LAAFGLSAGRRGLSDSGRLLGLSSPNPRTKGELTPGEQQRVRQAARTIRGE